MNHETQNCHCPEFALSRRRLLAGAVAGALGVTVADVIGDAHRQLAFGAPPGGNVLVVLSLRGGADGLSLVVPRGPDHDLLAAARPGLHIPRERLVGGNADFGLHPALEPLLPMWTAGTFGAVHAVGLPAPNRSHFEAIEEVERAAPGSIARVGWLNRMIGLSPNAAPQDALQVGSAMLPAALLGSASALAAYQLSDFEFGELGRGDGARMRSLHRMWDHESGEIGRAVRLAMGATTLLRPLADADIPTDAYPDGPLQEVLANTAALLKADLGTRVVTIDYGDWDMHSGAGTVDSGWMTEHAGHLAASLSAFFTDIAAIASRVTLVTLSEFGRRVEENGDYGTDHGYANSMFLLGAGVNGGTVHGRWPGLTTLNEGDLALGQDYRSVLWEVIATRFPEFSGGRATVFPGFVPEPIGAMRA